MLNMLHGGVPLVAVDAREVKPTHRLGQGCADKLAPYADVLGHELHMLRQQALASSSTDCT